MYADEPLKAAKEALNKCFREAFEYQYGQERSYGVAIQSNKASSYTLVVAYHSMHYKKYV